MFNYWTVCHLSITGWFVKINWLSHCPTSSAPALNVYIYTVKRRDAYALACTFPTTKRFPEADFKRTQKQPFLHDYFWDPLRSSCGEIFCDPCNPTHWQNKFLLISAILNLPWFDSLNFFNFSHLVLLLGVGKTCLFSGTLLWMWPIVHDGFSGGLLYIPKVSTSFVQLLIPRCIVIFKTLDQLSVSFHKSEYFYERF